MNIWYYSSKIYNNKKQYLQVIKIELWCAPIGFPCLYVSFYPFGFYPENIFRKWKNELHTLEFVLIAVEKFIVDGNCISVIYRLLIVIQIWFPQHTGQEGRKQQNLNVDKNKTRNSGNYCREISLKINLLSSEECFFLLTNLIGPCISSNIHSILRYEHFGRLLIDFVLSWLLRHFSLGSTSVWFSFNYIHP